MTTQTKETLIQFGKRNAISVGTFFTVIAAILHMNSSWVLAMDEIKDMKEHGQNIEVHMPISKRTEMFIPRREFEITLKGLEKTVEQNQEALIRIENRLNR